MKFLAFSSVLLLSSTATTNAFSISTQRRKTYSSGAVVLFSSNQSNDDRLKEIMGEEMMNETNMKASAEQLKNMTPGDIENMIKEMDNMPAAQLNEMKSMGMDVDMMKNAMQMMKTNPAMMESMGKMMESLTPEQLMQQSKMAQQQMMNLNPNAAAVPSINDNIISNANIVDDDEDDDEEEDDGEVVEIDAETLDTFYRVAELMSEPQLESGGVTFEAFATLPPITVLVGDGSADDCLTRRELKECWANGAKDPTRTTRVDRAVFEKVWMEVQDEFYNNIVEEARERCHTKKGKKPKTATASAATPSSTPTSPVVGANIDPSELADKLKNISDDDLNGMFEQMNDMSPEQEERMRAMNVDPEMMKKSAAMFKNNPLLRNAASMMMKNASPEQLMKASQQAQEKIANMSEEDKKKMMDGLK